MIDEISYEDLTFLVNELISLLKKNPDLSTKINRLLTILQTMRVSRHELNKLEEDFHRGNVTEDTYYTRRKKLVMDYIKSKDEMLIASLNELQKKVTNKKEKTIINKIKSAINNNADWLSLILQLIELMIVIS